MSQLFNEKIEFKGNYFGGEFRSPEDPRGEWKCVSPADLNDHYATVSYSYADVDTAIDLSKKAFQSWKRTSLEERKNFLTRYQEILLKKKEELARVISREMGKPLWEARTEVGAMAGKVSITIEQSLKLVSDFHLEEAAPGVPGSCTYRPLGSVVVIGPFNFPGHLANGHIVPALLTGNTVIFKPSEKTPMTGQVMAECFHEAGFPKDVFQLIQGEKEVGRRLVVHENIDGVLFTGSYEVGLRIKQDTLAQHWKLLALEMGGKNTSIVHSDAHFDTAIKETLVSAFITTGQRCSCTSRILVHESLIDRFVSVFHEKAKNFKIGHPLEEVFMGPLIDQTSMDRYQKFQGIASREGCELVMRGKALETATPGYYVTPSISLVKDSSIETAKRSVYQQTELFSPNVAIIPYKEFDEAIAHANVTQYGLVTSLFSQDRTLFEKGLMEIEAGLVNWNKSTVGASSKLPFGGVKKSGNHFPTALTSTQYCTYPVASLEVSEPSGAGNFVGLGF